MKQFLTVVVGGLFAVFAGVGISWGAGMAWRDFGPRILAVVHESRLVAGVVSAITKTTEDGTFISGIVRGIRYSAHEEEDLVNTAAEIMTVNKNGKVSAGAYIVKDLSTGTVITESNPDKLMPVASLTKLVTAIVARRLIPADTAMEITPQIIGTFGNTAGFRAGETFVASDLLYPLLMVSSNDAAEAYAREFGRKAFIQAMNDFVQSIGAYRTYFVDPSGLSPDNKSTVGDMAIILDWIRKNDQAVVALTALKSKTIRNHTWINPAHFLSWSYYVGGKNGFTDEAGRTSASLFELGQNKNVYAVVVLNSSNRDSDTIKLISKIK